MKRLDDEGPDKLSVSLEVSCVTADGNSECLYRKDHAEFMKDSSLEVMSRRRWGEILSGNTSMYLPDGNFTMQCKLWTSLQSAIPRTGYIAVTHIERKKVSCKLRMEGFRGSSLPPETELPRLPYYNEVGEYIAVALFREGGETEHLSISFGHEDLELEFVRCVCQLTVLGSRDNCLGLTEECFSIQPSEESQWQFSRFIEIEKLEAITMLSPGEILTFLFEFTYDVDVHSRIVEEKHAAALYA